MEIVQSRYGLDRVYEKISPTKILVMGDSQFQRYAKNEDGVITMFDFEGGPYLSVGSQISFQKLKWEILSIKMLDQRHKNLVECLLEVKMVWPTA